MKILLQILFPLLVLFALLSAKLYPLDGCYRLARYPLLNDYELQLRTELTLWGEQHIYATLLNKWSVLADSYNLGRRPDADLDTLLTIQWTKYPHELVLMDTTDPARVFLYINLPAGTMSDSFPKDQEETLNRQFNNAHFVKLP